MSNVDNLSYVKLSILRKRLPVCIAPATVDARAACQPSATSDAHRCPVDHRESSEPRLFRLPQLTPGAARFSDQQNWRGNSIPIFMGGPNQSHNELRRGRAYRLIYARDMPKLDNC